MEQSLLKVIDFRAGKRNTSNQSAIEAMCSLSHPRIVPVKGVYVDAKNLYIVTDYIGTTHKSILSITEPMSENQIRKVVKQILEVIDYAHEKKITITNLHPENVFLSNDGECDILLTDIGLGSLKGGRSNKLSVHMDFSAPEISQTRCESLSQSDETGMILQTMEDSETIDIWSLGMLVKYMATGSTSINLKHLSAGSVHSPELLDFLCRTLQDVPGRRMKTDKLHKHPFIKGVETGAKKTLVEQIMITNERDRVRDKLRQSMQLNQLEQVFLHLATSSDKEEILTQTLRIAFDNQLYFNTQMHLGIRSDEITV